MTREHTPPSKRANQEASSSSEWKMKAIERREENELLKDRLQNLEGKVNRLEGALKHANDNAVDDLKRQLEIANKIIAHQQEEILELKKKPR